MTTENQKSWPHGCSHPNSCSQHGMCGYLNCVHQGRRINDEITASLAAIMNPKPLTLDNIVVVPWPKIEVKPKDLRQAAEEVCFAWYMGADMDQPIKNLDAALCAKPPETP